MRIALISDIHGHATALDAVLTDIRQQQVDVVVCLGDVATIGPQPREVLDQLRALQCVCISGNHEESLLHPYRALELKIAPVLLPTLQWTLERLTTEDFAFLRSFQPTFELTLGPVSTMLCYHGSPTSNIELILSTTPSEELDRICPEPRSVMVGGHSHIQMLRQHRGTLFLNPGSVGNAFVLPANATAIPSLLPWAEYAILDSSAGKLSVDLRRVTFNIAAFRQIVTESDNPSRDWWLEQYG
jgi:predicted phosphodiesterase